MSNLVKEEEDELRDVEGWNRLVTSIDYHLLEKYVGSRIEMLEKKAKDLSKSPSLDNSMQATCFQFGAEKLRDILKRKIYIRSRYGELKKENKI